MILVCILISICYGGGGHDHGHDHGASGLQGEEFGIQYSLYQKIDLENVSCLNEEIDDSGKTVFKAWEDRKNRDQVRSAYFQHSEWWV